MSYVGEIKNGVLKGYVGSPPKKLRITTQVTKVGAGAFREKQNLTEVTFHDAVTEIGNNAFFECWNLKKVHFPQGLRIIGSAAFAECPISSLELPDSIEEIGACAFAYTQWLEEQEGNVYAGGFLIRAEPTEASFEIEPGTKGIVGGAFDGCISLTSISIPEGVYYIGELAFSYSYGHLIQRRHGCESLAEITIPDSVRFIGKDAFTGCFSLRKITISPETVKRLGASAIQRAFFAIPELSWDNEETFRKSLPLRVLLGENIELGELQESLNSFLRKKDIRKALTQYLITKDESEALGRLLSVQKKLPLDEIEEYFTVAEKRNLALCKALLLEYKNKEFSEANVADYEQDKVEKELGLKELSVAEWRKVLKFSSKDGKTIISGYNSTSAEVVIPEKIGTNVVSEIRAGAFKKDRTRRSLQIKAGIEVIPEEAFYKSGITNIELPPSLLKIGDNAFRVCTYLAEITLPPKVNEIGRFAFHRCFEIRAVKLSTGLRIIREYAFGECSSLESVSFANGLETIEEHAFERCNNLKLVRLPDTLDEIGFSAFWHCDSLTDVYLGSQNIKFDYNPFSCCDNLTIHAPAGSSAEQFAKENNIPFVAED